MLEGERPSAPESGPSCRVRDSLPQFCRQDPRRKPSLSLQGTAPRMSVKMEAAPVTDARGATHCRQPHSITICPGWPDIRLGPAAASAVPRPVCTRRGACEGRGRKDLEDLFVSHLERTSQAPAGSHWNKQASPEAVEDLAQAFSLDPGSPAIRRRGSLLTQTPCCPTIQAHLRVSQINRDANSTSYLETKSTFRAARPPSPKCGPFTLGSASAVLQTPLETCTLGTPLSGSGRDGSSQFAWQ